MIRGDSTPKIRNSFWFNWSHRYPVAVDWRNPAPPGISGCRISSINSITSKIIFWSFGMLHLTRDCPVPSVWFQTFSASVAQAMLCCLQLISILLPQQKCATPGWIFTCAGSSIHNWTSCFTTSFKNSLLKYMTRPDLWGSEKKKTPKAHHGFAVRSKLTLDQWPPSYECVTWLTQPHCFFLGREKYDGGGLFWESRAPLLSLLGCQKSRIWRTIVNCGLVSAGEADFKAPKLARDSHENGICPMEKKHRKSSISQILHLWDPTSLEKAASKPSLGKFPLMWLAGDFKTVHLKIRCISEEDHYEPPL